ncbi:unnamed protein product [Lepeophtheirus salmonis]|uniref:(salmon louse) hypothetical protein n=1 Tax=Lepeophtheirus salmonis TaxID=72036 RepID=A0A7R8GZC3_LEPSM|nr:unnamed protein product [Lepeophtheirus salmonis]CAB4054710.1 unnamed protein product [Lepeophtheirus salmonis]CAF2761304.1 unnamed protein product [Lepeophtheirus salmonis]CAF2761587.1 unnamed protein product [Lepeophtheirus salmonis]
MGYFQSQFLPIIVLLLGIISIQSGVSLPMNETMQEESPRYKTGLCIPNENGGKACVCVNEMLQESICQPDNEEKTSAYMCAGYCQVIGRQTGNCENNVCECSRERFYLSRDYLCVANEVCSMHCQIVRGGSNGKCSGPNNWDCECDYGFSHDDSMSFNSTSSD